MEVKTYMTLDADGSKATIDKPWQSHTLAEFCSWYIWHSQFITSDEQTDNWADHALRHRAFKNFGWKR